MTKYEVEFNLKNTSTDVIIQCINNDSNESVIFDQFTFDKNDFIEIMKKSEIEMVKIIRGMSTCPRCRNQLTSYAGLTDICYCKYCGKKLRMR